MRAQRGFCVKQMVDVYLHIEDDIEAQSFLNSLLCLRNHGFISEYDWCRFFDIVHDSWLSRP